ncbi:SGNH/GDSL hydrolase family protein [Caldimonas thermodepolymerans]|jgi:hypothetical protein|nr:SGNH/GDSL hydrolase family protein [Caldimonas thermodepolymerans]QPC32949.1 SGNH/GDSL hydrolase family protein [Caldimonas thermodepolymerans]UZG45817.1 SGNH/GDSL hydrolase family protein [Caldimonas thermodepolymerans]UZG49711.1 SGNH/GDSL hydrolase family protein [Caldimonas thermodepolymerans]
MPRWSRLLCGLLTCVVVVAVGAAVAIVQLDADAGRDVVEGAMSQWAVPLAVLGDSDSHAYHDTLHFPPGSPARGGPYRAITFQWTEVLARLRPEAIDLGPWGRWGMRRSWARVLGRLGRTVRAPRKEDHRHNFAVSGARCEDLLDGWRQTYALKQLMDEDPDRWARGVVVVRIGINSFGSEADLDRLAHDPRDPQVQAEVARCLDAIAASVDLIRASHPRTRFVLVGIFDNSRWARADVRWQDPVALHRIASGLDRFDDGLRRLARERRDVAFFDDRAWFAARWGGRDPEGRPAYRDVMLGGVLRVSNTAGDAPHNAVLADRHAGTVWNGWWAAALVELMNQQFGLGIAPMTDCEIASLLVQDGEPDRLGACMAADPVDGDAATPACVPSCRGAEPGGSIGMAEPAR